MKTISATTYRTAVLFSILATPFFSAYAANPGSPIQPSDNIQDPGALTTPWGGCGPTDSNCYVNLTAGSFLTLTVSGNATLGTAASTTNSFGSGTGATNTIGNATGATTLNGATTFSVNPKLSTMTQGSVLFTGPSGLLSQDNANFFWDNTNSRLGIGTSTPLFKIGNTSSAILDRGPGLGTATNSAGIGWSAGGIGYMFALENTGVSTTNNGMSVRTAATDAATTAFNVSSGTTQRFVVLGNGNIGVGKAAPTTRLHVDSVASSNVAQFESSAAANPYITVGTAGTNAGGGVQYDGSSTALRLYDNGSTGGVYVNDSDVGVGIANPSARLHVLGSELRISDGAAKLLFTDSENSVTTGYIEANRETGINIVSNVSKGAIMFKTEGSKEESMRIDQEGRVGIGTTEPSAQFHATGTLRFSGFGAGTLTTDESGNVTTSSDERLKNIDGTFVRGIEDLNKINPISYHWSANSGLDQKNQYTGFSAQNIQASIPEAVSVDPRGYLSLQDRPILATVVNALKEVWVKVTGQETQLAQLRADNELLKARISALESLHHASSITALGGGENVSAADVTAPTVTITGETVQTIVVGTPWSDLGATAADSSGIIGEIMATVGTAAPVVAGQATIDTTTVGDYTIAYHAIDAAGNIGTAERVVHVVAVAAAAQIVQ